MKLIALTINVFFFFTSFLFAQAKDSCCYHSLNSRDFYLLTQTKDVLIIDTRSQKAFKTCRIENAHLASERQVLEKLLENESRERIIVVYCDEGKRSKGAAKVICSELKFTKVYSLEGGISRWKKEDYPVVKD